MDFQVNKPIIIAITANLQIAIQKNTTIEAYITRALKCKPSAGDMIIKKPED